MKINFKAFTLAEILITLGIIGVVAALTIPLIIEKYQKKVFATKVKQTYNIVSNALIFSIQENGAPSTWDFGTKVNLNESNKTNLPEDIEQMATKYFLPYFVSASSKKTSTGYYIILANGTTLTFNSDGNINKDSNIYIPTTLYITASFKGKTSSMYSSDRDYSREDVVMVVRVSTTDASRLKFFQWDGDGDLRERIKTNSYYGCNKNIRVNKRFNCGALIQYDGWKIKEDYPW